MSARDGGDQRRWHTCERCGKRLFDTRKGARANIRDHINPKGMREYRCPHGDGFHVGHLPQRVREGKITSREVYDR